MLIEHKYEDKTTYSYKNYVCPYCLYTLNECKCEVYPPHHLVMIDIGIQHVIRVLNKKGYKTIGCCEGHYGLMSPSIHIIFNRNYNYKLPEGFKMVKNGTGIEHDYNRKISEEDWKIEKKKYLEILTKWAEGLPDIDNGKRR